MDGVAGGALIVGRRAVAGRPVTAGDSAALRPPGIAARVQTAARQGGVAFLALLIVLAALGVGLAATGTLWQAIQEREKERELIFIGRQYRHAIRQYYHASPGVPVYPPNLEALLLDARQPGIRRYLRRPWRDPLTGRAEWGLVHGPGGRIMGIYSLAPGRPRRQAHFPAELGWREGAGSYADWVFIYLPPGGQEGFRAPLPGSR